MQEAIAHQILNMMDARFLVLIILMATLAMFLWGRWRHDLVAIGALLLSVLVGLVPGREAFGGFGHPAVITVACVLVLGYGLQLSGAVDILAQRVLPKSANTTLSIFALISLAALLSGFMNNVGALALLMPLAIQMASKQNLPPGKLLMPLAFGSILGGMTTLIGTPPNLIVSGFRQSTGTGGFSMFDFTPVGLTVAVAGILFIGLVGWRLVPTRQRADIEGFDTGRYLSEVRVLAGSKAIGVPLYEAEQMMEEADAQIVGLVRFDVRLSAPNPRRVLREDDVLVIEVEPECLGTALSSLGLKLEEEVPPETEEGASEEDSKGKKEEKNQYNGTAGLTEESLSDEEQKEDDRKDAGKPRMEETVIQELVVMPNSALIRRSATDIQLRTQYGINMLAISRRGRQSVRRLRSTPIQAGDVLLMQGLPEAISGFAAMFDCLPLHSREIRVPKRGQALTASLVMAGAVLMAALGFLPVSILFAMGALAYIVLGIVPLRAVYTSIDWPVIILLGAMLPIADAVAATGAADMIARFLLDNLAQGQVIAGLVIVMVVTMFLSDLMNNAATAAVMCPIAIGVAQQAGVNPDTFLMAVAVGASCAFLTPIGHQNNTLILGPGGFHFGDYWRMGLVLEIIVIAVSVPMILLVWGL